jgi:hypothetical protein
LNFAAELFRAARALVVTIWTPVLEEALSTAGRPPAGDLSSANESEERAARQLANEGARRASAVGLHAKTSNCRQRARRRNSASARRAAPLEALAGHARAPGVDDVLLRVDRRLLR